MRRLCGVISASVTRSPQDEALSSGHFSIASFGGCSLELGGILLLSFALAPYVAVTPVRAPNCLLIAPTDLGMFLARAVWRESRWNERGSVSLSKVVVLSSIMATERPANPSLLAAASCFSIEGAADSTSASDFRPNRLGGSPWPGTYRTRQTMFSNCASVDVMTPSCDASSSGRKANE